jgi:hypothetical protein
VSKNPQSRAGNRNLALTLCDEFAHFRYEFVRDRRYRFFGLYTSLVLDQGLILGLILVVCQNRAYLDIVPSFRQLGFAHWCFFLLRRRKAASGFPVNSYAVITNTLPGSGSGT